MPSAYVRSTSCARKRLRMAAALFAGYDDSGSARWSEVEQEACPSMAPKPTWSAQRRRRDDRMARAGFDYVNQMSVVSSSRSSASDVLGGDVPAWLVIDATATFRSLSIELVAGATSAKRTSSVGPRNARRLEEDSWTARASHARTAAPYLACGEAATRGCQLYDEGERTPARLARDHRRPRLGAPSETWISPPIASKAAGAGAQTAASVIPSGACTDEHHRGVDRRRQRRAPGLRDGERAR